MNLKESLEQVGYYATEELAMNMELLFNHELERDGVSSVCLDGLPGVGKTFLPLSLAKVFDYTYISYCCDNKTGPEQLLEDMNIPMMVKKDHEKAITKGVLLRAIDAVIRGEKVILVIDEFDKAARETDFYFLEFLQSGKTASATFGEVEIPAEKLSNLIVFICKNSERDVHEALMRRFNKFIEVQPPELETVRRILQDAVPNADEISKNAIISLYQMILEDAKDYKKLATIQEMKNALREDLVLKSWEKSDDVRMKNLLAHMVKFPEDRMLLNAKLTDMGLIELSDDEQIREKDVYTTMSLEKFFVNGYAERMSQLESQVHKLLNLLTKEAKDSIVSLEQVGELSKDEIELGEIESATSLEEISVLGSLTTKKVQANSALPKHVYNRSVVSLSKESAIYNDQQYILAELQLERKAGTYDDLIKAITAAKSDVEIDKVMHDGFVLASDHTNQIGLVHYIETEGMPPRIFLVADKPVLSDQLLYKAVSQIPRSIQRLTKISELDLNVVTSLSFDEISSRMDEVYDVSKDYTEIIGSSNGVTIGFSSETGMMKFKITRSEKKPTKQLLNAVQKFVSNINKSMNDLPFNPSSLKVLSVKDVVEMAKEHSTFNFSGYNPPTPYPQFKEVTYDGSTCYVFAEDNDGYTYNIKKLDDKVENIILELTSFTKEEFNSQYVVVSHDEDNDFYVYKLDKDGNGDSNYCRCRERLGGESLNSFIQTHLKTNEISSVYQKVNELNEQFSQDKLA